jgi:hypothetical protein
VSLIEVEYLTALLRAERDWLRSVTDDIRDGRLTWAPPSWQVDSAARDREPEGAPGDE